MPSSGIAGFYCSFIPSFLRISILFSIVVVSVCIPTNSVQGFPFSSPSPAFIVCRLFDDGHSDRCEMIPHCGFDLYFMSNVGFLFFFLIHLVIVCLLIGEFSSFILERLLTEDLPLLSSLCLLVILYHIVFFLSVSVYLSNVVGFHSRLLNLSFSIFHDSRVWLCV